MYFGVKGTSIPERKRYAAALVDGKALVNVTTWWNGDLAGWTQDATKELHDLRDQGIISTLNPVAKPTALLTRLLDIYSAEGEIVLEPFARSGDLLAAAASSGRRGIGLFGSSDMGSAFLHECACPRLAHVLGSAENLRVYTVGEPILRRSAGAQGETWIEDHYLRPEAELSQALMTSQGFLEYGPSTEYLKGRAFAGGREAVFFGPEVFLELDDLDEIASTAQATGDPTTLFYFRSGFDVPAASSITVRRVPMELVV